MARIGKIRGDYIGPFDALAAAMMGAHVGQHQLLCDESVWVWERLPIAAWCNAASMIWQPSDTPQTATLTLA